MATLTIKELYELAMQNGCENSPININYTCADCWYDMNDYKLQKTDVEFTNGGVNVELHNE